MKDKLLNLTSLLLSILVLIISILMLGQFDGFRRGTEGVSGPPIGFSAGGPNFYSTVTTYYSAIAILIALAVIIESLKMSTSRIFALLLSVGSLIFYAKLLLDKYDIGESPFRHAGLFDESIEFDWLCVGAIGVVAAIHLYSLLATSSKPPKAE